MPELTPFIEMPFIELHHMNGHNNVIPFVINTNHIVTIDSATVDYSNDGTHYINSKIVTNNGGIYYVTETYEEIISML